MINNISVTRNLLDERLSATDTLFRKYFSKQPTTYLNVDDLVIDTTGLKKSQIPLEMPSITEMLAKI